MLKCVLLDANIVIEAYKLGIWEKLIEQVEISVSSIVARNEVLFSRKSYGGVSKPINLTDLIKEGKIREFSASQTEMQAFLNKFDSFFVGGLHDGEAESLAIIMHGGMPDSLFCSSDATAIQALAMIGHSDLGVSFEVILKQNGLQKKLNRQFSEKFFKSNLSLGSQNLITGQGLKKNS